MCTVELHMSQPFPPRVSIREKADDHRYYQVSFFSSLWRSVLRFKPGASCVLAKRTIIKLQPLCQSNSAVMRQPGMFICVKQSEVYKDSNGPSNESFTQFMGTWGVSWYIWAAIIKCLRQSGQLKASIYFYLFETGPRSRCWKLLWLIDWGYVFLLLNFLHLHPESSDKERTRPVPEIVSKDTNSSHHSHNIIYFLTSSLLPVGSQRGAGRVS